MGEPENVDAAATEGGGRRALVHGPDEHGLADALREAGVDVDRVEGPTDAETLDAAGLGEADLFVLTDVAEAAAIPVAKERTPEVRAVAYAEGSLPEYVAGVVDLAVDPALLSASAVAEELAAD